MTQTLANLYTIRMDLIETAAIKKNWGFDVLYIKTKPFHKYTWIIWFEDQWVILWFFIFATRSVWKEKEQSRSYRKQPVEDKRSCSYILEKLHRGNKIKL